MLRTRRLAIVALLVAYPALGAQTPARTGATPASMSRIQPDVYGQLQWRTIGPEGNRFSSAAGIPGDHLTYYVGAASGGIWKTTDGGTNWTQLFDGQPVQSIGSLAIARSDPNIVWAGTGEAKDSLAHLRRSGRLPSRSTPARRGSSWGSSRPDASRAWSIHPQDPNTVLVCALGHAYGPQPERGVFRTTDGGATWTKVLFVDENTGCSDIAMDPEEPAHPLRRHVAARDQDVGTRERRPGERPLHVSATAARHGKRLTGRGLPDEAGRKSRGRHRAVQSGSRLRAHRDW